MPTVADPHTTRPLGELSDTSKRSRPFGVHVRTALQRRELTRELAEGIDPSASEPLALRAAQLTSERNRKALADTLRRTIAEARRPRRGRSAVVIIRRRAVVDATDAIEATIDRLSSPAPVRANGMAMLERILTNADNSPLYNSSSPGALAHEINVATAAMEPGSSDSHEFLVGV
jgi:hypothetical protein